MSKSTPNQKTKVDTGDSPTYWLKPEQIDRMRDATVAESAHYLTDRNDALLALMADTGLRVAETAALDASMIDFEDGVLAIPPSIQKGGGEPVTFSLKSDTLRTLRKYTNHRWYQGKETAALFPARSSDRISTQGIRNVVSAAAESSEVKPHSPQGNGSSSNVTPHTLRHSLAYRMIRREEKNLFEVSNRLRHASYATTEAYYAHFDVV